MAGGGVCAIGEIVRGGIASSVAALWEASP